MRKIIVFFTLIFGGLILIIQTPSVIAANESSTQVCLPDIPTQAIKNQKWHAVYNTLNNQSIVTTKMISTKSVYSEMEERNINIIEDKDLIFLIKSSIFPVVDGYTESLTRKPEEDNLTLEVNKVIPFQLNERKFLLIATGEFQDYVAKDYKVAISLDNELIPLPGIESNFLQDLLWIGDLNQDGYPELLLSTRTFSDYSTVRLYTISQDKRVKLLNKFSY